MQFDQIFQSQKSYFNSHQTKDVSFRIQQLKKFKSLLEQNEDRMYEAIMADFSKSKFETYLTEFGLLYQELNHMIKKLKRWSRPKKVRTGLTNFPGKSYIYPEPLGVTLVIGAWNYPYQLSLLPAATSLAAGNTVILKPSEMPSQTSSIMAELINDNFDPAYFHVIEGGPEETTDLLKNPFDKIFFTGSTHVGKIVYKAAAENLTPVTLELGGKSPTIITKDCNLKITVKRLVWAKFINAGQTCVAPDYLLVEKSFEKEFTEALIEEIKKYHTSSDIGENYLQIINERNFERLSQLIDKSKVCYGGHLDKSRRYISPTIMKNITTDEPVMKEEIFGPILPILTFQNIDEAIEIILQFPKPLSCYIYSSSKQTISKVLREVSFGGGAINDSVMHLANSRLPFGGVGFSGIGSYHGKTGFDAFSHQKSVLHKKTWLEPSLKYPPYTTKKMKLIKWLTK